jgi:hypothetical protein
MSAIPESVSLEPVGPPEACDIEDLWTAWRDACHDLRLAHRAWRESAQAGRRDAYFVLVAAADREAIAADTLSRITPLTPAS